MKIFYLLIGFVFVLEPVQAFCCGDENSHPTIPVFVKNCSNDVGKVIEIDACIAPIIDALQKAGIYTLTSCCGHGKSDGFILLEKGGLTVWKEKTGEASLERYKKGFQIMGGMWDIVHQSDKKKAEKKDKKQ